MIQLTKEEEMYIGGGDTPSKTTSAANDIAYYVVYPFAAAWKAMTDYHTAVLKANPEGPAYAF